MRVILHLNSGVETLICAVIRISNCLNSSLKVTLYSFPRDGPLVYPSGIYTHGAPRARDHVCTCSPPGARDARRVCARAVRREPAGARFREGLNLNAERSTHARREPAARYVQRGAIYAAVYDNSTHIIDMI